tara:strand:+ start:2725 stop:3333 length:609 start_codon:yes stop_codon:yes gene_type:complete
LEFILFDTEFTSWEGSMQRMWSKEWEERELVQISAIYVEDLNTLNQTKFFSVYTKPQINPKLSDYFINLTGIDQITIDNYGLTIEEGIKQFCDFSKDKFCFSWGDDIGVIKRNVDLCKIKNNLSLDLAFDIKEFFMRFNIETSNFNSGNIENFSNENSIITSGKEHNALSDCISMLSALIKLRKIYGLKKIVKEMNFLINKN